jgi:hypothetical protein
LTKIAVEGTIFALSFLKKYDLSLLLMEGRVLDRCWAFNRLVSVDAHLWPLVDARGNGVYSVAIIAHPPFKLKFKFL